MAKIKKIDTFFYSLIWIFNKCYFIFVITFYISLLLMFVYCENMTPITNIVFEGHTIYCIVASIIFFVNVFLMTIVKTSVKSEKFHKVCINNLRHFDKYLADDSYVDIDGGCKSWYKFGRLHRMNGPAIVGHHDKRLHYFVYGEFLGYDDVGFWTLWDILTDEQRSNTDFLYYLPGAR